MGDKKVAIFGNSVSAVPIKEDTSIVPFPDLLHRRLLPLGWQVVTRAIHGGTIAQIEAAVREVVEQEAPRAVILQVGLVDCVLRPLTERERAKLSDLRPLLLRDAMISFFHRFRDGVIRLRGTIQYTPLPEYLDSFRRILDFCYQRCCRIGVLPIFPVTESIIRRSRSLPSEIDRYNKGMQACDPRPYYFSVEEFLGRRPIEDVVLGPNSVHFNQIGHGLIAERLFDWMEPMMGDGKC